MSIFVTFLVPDQERLAADGVEDGEEAGLVSVAEHRRFCLFSLLFFVTIYFFDARKKNGEKVLARVGPGPVARILTECCYCRCCQRGLRYRDMRAPLSTATIASIRRYIKFTSKIIIFL